MKKILIVGLFTLSCYLPFPCFAVTQDVNAALSYAGVFIAVGQETAAKGAPLLLETADGGTTWSRVTNLSSGTLPENAILQGASCTGFTNTTTCIAVGAEGARIPVLLQTQNGGKTWSRVTTLSSGYFPLQGILYGASCTGTNTKICVAVGGQARTDASPAIILRTGDNGATWSKVESFISGTYPTRAMLYSVSCSGTVCVAAGNDTTNDNPTPLLIQSVDSGKTWARITTFTNGTMPSVGNLSGVSCSITNATVTCVAVGADSVSGAPLLITTRTGGKSWTRINTLTDATWPTRGFFSHAFCLSGTHLTDQICTASGTDHANGTSFLIQSTDGAKTWRKVSTVSNGPLPNGAIQSVHCISLSRKIMCSVVGNSSSALSDAPIIFQTVDSGATWQKVSTLGTAPLPTLGTLWSTSCTNIFGGGVCVAAGSSNYDNSPFLITTADSGKTWMQIETLTNVAMPNNAVLYATAKGD